MSFGTTFGVMFITLFVDAMWVRFMPVLCFAHFLQIRRLYGVTMVHLFSKFGWNSKLSIDSCCSWHTFTNRSAIAGKLGWWWITLFLHPTDIIDTNILGRSPRVRILFPENCVTHKSEIWFHLHADCSQAYTLASCAIWYINRSSTTLATSGSWIMYLGMSSILSTYPN